MNTETKGAREATQFKIRLPADLLDRLEASAQENGRSVTSEIVERLRSTLPDPMEELFAKSERIITQLRRHLVEFEERHGPDHMEVKELKARLESFERNHREMRKALKR